MDKNTNGPLPPKRPVTEEVPLLSMNPAQSEAQPSRKISRLSLQSTGSAEEIAAALAGIDEADGNEENPDKLHQACWSGNEAEVKDMLDKETDVNALDKSERTALHVAVLAHHKKILEMLLAAGADMSIVDRSQDPPLHTAVRIGDENLIQVFLRRENCDANIAGKGSKTALHIAAELDNVSVCKILIKHGASPDNCDDEKMTPLTRAVEKGSRNAAEFLFEDAGRRQKDIRNGILRNVDSEGSTLLHLAVDSGSPAVVQLCLDNGANIRQPKENNRSTAFHLACSTGSLEIVKLFVSKDSRLCQTTLKDSEGCTPLHLAARNNNSDVVQYLLNQDTPVDPRDNLRRTPLFLAAERGGKDTVKMLLDSGADVTAKDVDYRSCVRVAVGHAQTMEVLLQKREAVRLITDRDITGFAPVHYAAKNGNLQNILLFMKRNRATTTVTSDTLDTALHGAARYGRLEIVDELLAGRNIRSINVKNNQGKTALHFACVEGHDRVVERLLKLGATVESDHNDRTALHIAAMRGSKRCVQCIMQYQPQCINLFDKDQNTALHLAAMQGHPNVVSCLLSSDKQEILMNKKNQNVMDGAMEAEKKSVLLAIASHERWREVLTSSAPGHMAQMQALVIKYPEVAERFMDRCITKEGNPDGEDYKITYDLSLIQGTTQKPDQDHSMLLKTMLQNRRINCLTHPVCFIIMNTKWKTFGWQTLAINTFLYLLFLIPLTALAIYTRANEKPLCRINETWTRKEYIEFEVPCTRSNKLSQGLQYTVGIFAILQLIKELFQLKKQRLNYLLSFTNYLEWTGYTLALAYMFPACDCKLGIKQEIGAVALLFGWLNLILYLRRLSSYGQYVIMLTTMFVTLFKVLLLFFLFVMAFSSTFYLLMDEETEPYATFPYSMMTIFVMTLGELNYADNFIPWDKLEYPTMANILMVMFVLGMPIILMNMLVGLAVGDIEQIQTNAAMDRYVMQVELVLEMEETVLVPAWLAKRAHIAKHVERPNGDVSRLSQLYEQLLGFSRPAADDKEEEETPPSLPPEFHPLLERIEEQENRIHGIYDVLKEQSALLKTTDQAIKRLGIALEARMPLNRPPSTHE